MMAVMMVACAGIGVVQPMLLEEFSWMNGVFCLFTVVLGVAVWLMNTGRWEE